MSYLPPLKFAHCAQITPAVQPSLNVADLPSTAQLSMFLELAEQRSIKATAKRLGRARSTVGRTLKMLEWHFGTRLMQRTRPQMTLTPQGRALLDMLQTHFVPLAAAIGQLRAAQPALRVWVADKGVTRILERVWAGYRRKDPRRIVWVNDAREADLSIERAPEPARGDAEDTFLCADEWVAVSGAGWRGRTDLTPRDLVDYPIAFERAEDALAWQWFADADRPPEGQVMSRRAMARALKNGQAVALVNASHHAEAIAKGTLIPVSPLRRWTGDGMWARLEERLLHRTSRRDHGWDHARDHDWDHGWAVLQFLRNWYASDDEGQDAGRVQRRGALP